jgi:hypothetical protein
MTLEISKPLSRPNYIVCTVRNTIMAQFYPCEILDWNVKKSASRLYINAPKVE